MTFGQMPPIKPSTPEERSVLFWAILLALAGFGGWFIYLGLRAPAKAAANGHLLALIGIAFIAAAILLYIIRKLFARWLD